MAKFVSSSQFKYRVYPSVFYGFFGIIIPYLIIFLLFGEINLLGFNWNINNSITWQLYSIIFGMAPIAFFWLLIGKLTHTLSLDSFPFLASSVMLSIAVFISSLLPSIGNNDIENTLVIIGRVIIVLGFSIITFFIVNALVKIIIIRGPNFNSVIEKFSINVEGDEASNKKFKSVLDAWKKSEKKDDDFVEVSIKIKKGK